MPNSAPFFKTRAQGKLLLTGEYFVLDGALALALPVRYGQTLQVATAPENLHWQSLDHDGQPWFSAEFSMPKLNSIAATDPKTAETLVRLFAACRQQNPAFLTDHPGLQVITRNDFPRQWGLGTSSTLLAALARWAKVNPYSVLFDTLGGSGYDLACAYAEGPIWYQLQNGQPMVQPVDFQPPFADQLYFVYLDKKQDSRAGIERYRSQAREKHDYVEQISALTRRCTEATTLAAFENALAEHEDLVSEVLGLPRAKTLFFNDFWGEVKSLGAWGGDFVLVTSERSAEETQAFFNEKGFRVFIFYRDMTGFPRRSSF